jgi:hypothetical protein
MYKNYLLIDSKYKDKSSVSSSKFKYNLPRPIKIHSFLKINYLYLPRCNYLINSTNNYIKIYFISATSNVDIFIPQQNYTPLSLSAFLNVYMNKLFNFNCSYNDSTYKFEITADIDFYRDFSKSNFYKLVSLENIKYYSNNKKFTTNIINFNNPFYLNLNISNISNDVISTNNTDSIDISGNLNFGLETSNAIISVDNNNDLLFWSL